MTDFIQVITTVDGKGAAEQIAEELVEQKLAACVQISTCRSIYRWRGKVERTDEYCCVIKTRSSLFPELERVIRRIHPYDVPEIIATQVSHGNREYLEWLARESGSSRTRDAK
jgi:periplasmic divalent cation tolerance protein